MLSRIKFRIVGGEYSGKYVCNIENGKTVFFNRYFRPQERDALDTCFSIIVEGSETQINFIGNDFLWNGKPLAPVVMGVKSGDSMSWNTHGIEILECPQAAAQNTEKTKFLDLTGVFKRGGGGPKMPDDEPPPITPDLKEKTKIALSLTPIPKRNQSIIAPLPGLEAQTGSFSQVESSLVMQSFGGEAKAPEIEGLEIPEKIVVKSEDLEKIITNSAIPAPAQVDEILNIQPLKQSEIKVVPMKRSLGVWFQVATMGTVFLCFGSYVYNRFLVAKNAFEFHAESEPASKKIIIVENAKPIESEPTVPDRNIASVPPESAPIATESSAKQIESSATPIDLSPPATDYKAAVFAAIDSNDISGMKKLVEEDLVDLNFTDSTGKTPVTHAAAMGRLSILKIFAAKNADLNVKDSEGYSALMWAVLNEKKNTIQFLIEQGVDRKYKRENGKNAFAMAKESKNKDLIKLFSSRVPASNANTQK